MRVLVTGANGFLGRHVVASALRRGHNVHAMLRLASDERHLAWATHPAVTLVRADLRARSGLEEAVGDVDAVLHLAAAKSGDLYAQFSGTVCATENLLAAMDSAGVHRVVGVSSFSVFDYSAGLPWKRIDEDAPLDSTPGGRDAYALTKRIQEELIREWGTSVPERSCVVLRPGVIYGRENLWTARLGFPFGSRWWVRTGAWAPLPLTYVENCAEAIVQAAEVEGAADQVLNVVDDEMPSQRSFIRAIRRRENPTRRLLRVPWTIMRLLAGSAWLVDRVFLGGRAKIPSILVPARLNARCKPHRYCNTRVKDVLGWTPRYSLGEALDRSLSDATLEVVDGSGAAT